MRFYYISIFSVMLLGVLYLLGTGLLVWIWYRLRKWKRAWVVMVPLFLLLYIAPIAEELWIAWNFGRLCSKDAGIFVYKTVEVDGFYDDTRTTHASPPTPQAVESFNRSGYRFLEMRGPEIGNVVHLEKIEGRWEARVLDAPTARYEYKRINSHTLVAHQIKRFENIVLDNKTNEVLGRYVNYYRGPYWFFIHLDKPTIACEETEADTRRRGTISVDALVLLPVREPQEAR